MAEVACGQLLCWWGLYRGQYDLLSPDSYAHPAKMAPGLCYRIFEHLKEMGLLGPESIILDPMAGTGMTGLVAATLGHRAILVELESRFCGFMRENKEALERKLGRELPIEIIQGDARKLSGLLAERGLVAVSSPPYSDSTGKDRAERWEGNYWNVNERGFRKISKSMREANYGDTPGQIGQLPDRPLVITSPPYGDQESTTGWSAEHQVKMRAGMDLKWGKGKSASKFMRGELVENDNPANIGNLPDRPLTAITSPPYSYNTVQSREDDWTGKFGGPHSQVRGGNYGEAEGQIGQEQGSTYLSAMAQVYAEVARVADVLVVVVKCPTRVGKLRRLDLDTIALLEATGWRINCVHHAMLFEEQEQGHLFDGSRKQVKGRMSFFKRLAWQKGSMVAQWEDVLVVVKGG